MDSKEDQVQDVKDRIVQALRKRAKVAHRNANIALISIFIILFSGILLFYFAGDIVLEQSRPVEMSIRENIVPPPDSSK